MKIKIFILLLTISITSVFSQSADFTTSLTNNENCGGTIVTFTINDTTGLTDYKWEFGNGEPDAIGTIDAGNDGTASTSYVSAGDFTVQLTVNGNISTVQQITIHALPTPDFQILNGTEEECINATADVEFQYIDNVPQYGANIVEWSWNFGDGTGAHTQTGGGDVTYTYSLYGDYTVLLDVTDANGCTSNTFKTNIVKLHSTPKADFSINKPTDCSLPITVDFTDNSVDEQSSIISYEWTFTDITSGVDIGSSTEQNPSFTFVNEGDYYATLKVTTNAGCTDEMTQTLNFKANTTSFTPNTEQHICAGHSVSFTNTSVDGNGTPTSFYWDFGDGETSTDENPTHTYNSAAGSPYTVTLQVTFSNGCIGTSVATDLVQITSIDGLAITVDKNQSCMNYTVNATAGTGAILYQWDFEYNDTTPSFDKSGISNQASYNYTDEGTYRIFLRATNTNGCFADTIYDSISVEYPKADFIVTNGQYGCMLVSADFDASSSSNQYPIGQNAITDYAWDFQNNNVIDQTGSSATVSHFYSQYGSFDVKLIITTETGCSDTIVKTNSVERGLPPVADFTFNQSDLCINTPVHFTNTSHPNILFPTAQIDSIIWNFGDGTIITGNPLIDPSLNTPTHIYTDDTQDDAIPYTVTLTVFNYGCNSATHTEQLDIDYPVARFTPSQVADCTGGGEIISLDAYNGDLLSEGVDEFRWDFGDGTFYPGPTANEYQTGNDPTTNIVYSSVGHYPITLYVKNSNSNCSDSETHEIIVEQGYVNFATTDTIICRDVDEVHFTNLSVSSEPGIEYTWDFGADANPATYTGSTPPAVTYSTNGEKTITLTSNDPNTSCGNVKTKTNYISVRGPQADFDWTSQNADDNIACLSPGEDISFTSTSSTHPNANTNISFEWVFGLGANPSTATRTNENPIDVSYSSVGKKTITLKVTDNLGCIDEYTHQDAITVPDVKSDFIIDANVYCTTHDITFTDNSDDATNYNLTDWQWNFGADATPATFSGQTPPQVVYSTKGTKTVNLVVTNEKGCNNTYTKDFQMYQANASFTNIIDAGCAPADVQFTNTSEDITSWEWDFGDPLSPSQSVENPSNIYIYPGEYDVTLITTSIGGCKDTIVKSADVLVDGSYYDSLSYVIDQPCLFSPANPEVTFTIYGLTDTKYVVFDFGDGSPAYNYTVPDILNPPATLDITHTYDHIGTFLPKLTLQDDPTIAGACGQFIYTPSVSPIVISKKPTAQFSDNSLLDEVCSGSQVDFTDESINNDPAFPINTWAWEFGDTGSSTSSNQNPSFTYTDADIGNVDVKLTVTNAMGCFDDFTKSLTIVPGLEDLTVATNDTVCAGITVTLDAEQPTGGDGTYVYLWKQSIDGGSSWQAADGINDQEDYITPSVIPTSHVTIYYKRKVSSATCNLYTPEFSLTIDPSAIGGTILPNPVTECFGDNHNTLTVNGSLSQVVEWQSDVNADFSTYTTIPNTTTSLTYDNLTETTYYRVLVVSGVCPTVFSDTAIVNVKPEITGNRISPNDTLVCAMQDPGVISATAPQGGTGSFTYQWQQSADNINFVDIVGETNETYSPGGLMETLYYRRAVTSDGACTVFSDTSAINVIPQPDTTLNVSDPFVCAEDYSSTPNTNIVISNSEIDVEYQAFLVSDDSPQSGLIAGTGSDIDISVVTPITTTDYYIVARPTTPNDAGDYCPVVLADHSTITIVPIPSDALAVSDPTICEGQDAVITVSASEIDVKYELKLAGTIIASAQGDGNDIDFVVSPGPSNTTTYEVWATSSLNAGACSPVLMVDPAIITVIPLPDNSLTVSDPQVCGEDVNFNITVSNTADTVDYMLIPQGGTVLNTLTGTGADLTFTVPTPPTASVYEIWAKPHNVSDYGVCDSIKLSDVANVTYAPIPDITLSVSNDIICNGDNAEITISVSENNVEYTLTPSGNTVLGNGADVSFPLVSPAVTTTYTITAKSTIISSCSDVTLTNNSTVTVIPTPINLTITTSPDPANICSGDNFTITVENTENNVKYILKAGSTATGDEFIGDGTNQTFTVNPISDTTYSVWAIPTDLDADGNECSSVQIGADIPVYVDGPITIDIQPIDAQVCSGATAILGVTASNASGDPITYQWQEDSGSGFVDMPGETSATVSVASPNSSSFRVIVGSTYCNSVTSNSVTVNSSSTPVTDQLTLTIDDVCLGNDVQVAYQSNLSTNEYYRIYFNITGTNPIADTSVVTLLTNGSGTFYMPADSFTNVGANALIITAIDYAYGQGCESSGLAVTDLFTIEALPDTINLGLSSNNICLGSDAEINLSGNLSDGVYNIVYDLLGANNTTASTGQISISSGVGTFNVPNSELINAGTTQFVLTQISNTWGLNCPISALTYQTQFDVEPMPDVTNLAVSIPNICTGDSAIANITGNLIDGDYQILYNLSGANASSNIVNVTLANGDGTASFVIPETQVQYAGTTQFELTDISFVNGQACAVSGLSVQTDFDVEQTPYINGMAIYAPNICEEENAIVYFTSNLPDGNYLVHYKVVGDVPTYEQDITLSLNSGNGNSSFTIDAANLPVSGFNTISLTSIENTFGNQCQVPLSVNCPLTIEPLPDTTMFAMQVDTICPNTDARVYITGNMIDGHYLLSYDLSGANSATGIPVYVHFVNGDGTAEFSIPGTELANEGLTTITLKTANFFTGQQCGINNINIDANFMVESIPDINTLTLNSNNICVGNSNTIDIISTLADGDYVITYNVENSNYHTGLIDTINIVSGASNFVVDAINLDVEGPTTVVLTDIISATGQQCDAPITTAISTSFDVEPLPLIQGANFIALDACQGDDVEVYGTSNLIDGEYMIYYHITGVNTWPSDSAIIDIITGDGNVQYTIPAASVPNFGASTIWIDGIRFNSGESCYIADNYQSNFTIAKVPEVTNLVAVADTVCLGSYITVDLISNLDDGTYIFTTDITGVNPNANVEFEADIAAGTGQFIIPENLLLNVGDNIITIKNIKNKDGAQCASNVYNTFSNFKIEDIPHINNFDFVVNNVCLTFDAQVSIVSELEDGDYTLTYDLTGSNTATDQTIDVNIVSGNATFSIPTSLLPTVGATDCIITNVKNKLGLTCDVDMFKSASFIVIPDPGSTSVSITAEDICLTNDALVEITSIFPDGDVDITYDLTGINDTTNLHATATFTGGAGIGAFVIPDTVLKVGGVQNIVITGIDFIGATCSSTGLNISTDFIIEGDIEITQQPIADTKCEGQPVSFEISAKNNGGGNFYYLWYEFDGTDTIALNNQGVFSGTTTSKLLISDNTGLENTMYKCVIYTDHCPIIVSDSVKLEILTGSDCGDGLENIPDAISPNGDGTNDTWVIDGIDNYPDNHIKIYSRWGNLVFETTGYTNTGNNFNGTGNTGAGAGKDVADGTYFYFIDLGDGQKIIQGYIVINR